MARRAWPTVDCAGLAGLLAVVRLQALDRTVPVLHILVLTCLQLFRDTNLV